MSNIFLNSVFFSFGHFFKTLSVLWEFWAKMDGGGSKMCFLGNYQTSPHGLK